MQVDIEKGGEEITVCPIKTHLQSKTWKIPSTGFDDIAHLNEFLVVK